MTPEVTIWNDSIIAIWNELQPQRIHHAFSSLYPAVAVIALFTFIHILMDRFFYFQASSYAKNATNISTPKWILPQEQAELMHKLSQMSIKQFAKYVKKFDFDNAAQLNEMISYQKKCIAYGKHISKYQEALFKVIVFGFVYFYGLALLINDGEWFWNQEAMWKQTYQNIQNGLPPQSAGNENNVIFNLNIYYFLQIGYHGHRAIYQFFEYSRRDFLAMFVHHWVTVLLLVGSKMCGYQQFGASVLLCNDNLDLLMPLAKLSEYTQHKTLQNVFTISFCVLWIPLRIGVYFYKVIYSVLVDGYLCIRTSAVCWICIVGLAIIYILQFYWTKYLLAMVWRKVFKGRSVKDIRSDGETDDEETS